MEVLARAVDHLLCELALLHRRPGPGELGEVREDAQRVDLALKERRVVGREGLAQRIQLGDQPAGLGRADVVAQEQAADRAEDLRRAPPGIAVRRRGGDVEDDARPPRLAHGPVDPRLHPQERRSGVDLDIPGDQDLGHHPVERGGDRGLHLHALEHHHRRPGRHRFAGHDGHGHHQRGRAGRARARPPRARPGARRRPPRSGGPAGGPPRRLDACGRSRGGATRTAPAARRPPRGPPRARPPGSGRGRSGRR